MYVPDLGHTQAEVVSPEATSGGTSRVGMGQKVVGDDGRAENHC